jgi:hypothetical protein
MRLEESSGQGRIHMPFVFPISLWKYKFGPVDAYVSSMRPLWPFSYFLISQLQRSL